MNENVPAAQPSVMPQSVTSAGQGISALVQTAKAYPRDVTLATKNCITLATANKDIAKSCIYCRPVGKDRSTGLMKFADGPSIRLAEIARAEWGNLKVGTRFLEEMDGYIRIQWVAYDCEKNVESTGEVTKNIMMSNGQRMSDNQVQVISQAGQAIATRNAVFSIVPLAFVEQMMDKIREKMVGSIENLPATFDAICNSLKKIGVSRDRVLAFCDLEDESKLTNKHCVSLINVMNAIHDHICSIDEVFPITKGNTGKPVTSKPTPKAAPKQEPAPKAPQNTPVEQPVQQQQGDSGDPFIDKVTELCGFLNITIEDAAAEIDMEFSIPFLNMVPEDMKSQVIKHFEDQLQ